MPFIALLRKELLEQWRTRRLWVLAIAFVFFGLLGPITAKMTPELLKLVGSSAPGVVIQIPPPTLNDAIMQYMKNLSQLLPLIVLLVAMGAVSGEKERGTLPMVLAKPVSRAAVLAAKYLVLAFSVLLSLTLGALVAYYYTQVLFGGLGLRTFLDYNLSAGLQLLVVLTLTFLASTVASGTVMAGALAFGLCLLSVVAGSIPLLGRSHWWLPALVVAALLGAWLHFRAQEW